MEEHIIIHLYGIFGLADLSDIEDDLPEAIRLAKEEYPDLSEDQIENVFIDFLHDDPPSD